VHSPKVVKAGVCFIPRCLFPFYDFLSKLGRNARPFRFEISGTKVKKWRVWMFLCSSYSYTSRREISRNGSRCLVCLIADISRQVIIPDEIGSWLSTIRTKTTVIRYSSTAILTGDHSRSTYDSVHSYFF
jgi:hypothetical protein